MMSDDFIESVITPNPQTRDEAMNRKFIGMEAVAQFDEDLTDDFGRARDGLAESLNVENGGDNE